MKAMGAKEFTRHYQFSDVAIFIRIWEGGDYIRVRAGNPGDYLVVPVVKKLSTVTTTTGLPCFLNSKLTKATRATDFANATDVLSRVSKFPHKASKSSHFTGAVDTVPTSIRGYFKRQKIVSAGNPSLNSYAGIFRHQYTDPVTGASLHEFLHGRATLANPTTNASDGFYYHSASLGNFFFHFNSVGLRRPAIHESMFASEDGKRVVTEEQFMPGNTLGYADYFIERSIMDVDVGAGTVLVYNHSSPGPYGAGAFEARGAGSVILTTPTAEQTVLVGEFTYPVCTALDIAKNQIHLNARLVYDTNDTIHHDVIGTVSGPGTTRQIINVVNLSEKVHLSVEGTGLATATELVVDRVENTTKNSIEFYQGAGPVNAALTTTPFDSNWLEAIFFTVEYADAATPVLIYSYKGTRVHATSAHGAAGVTPPADTTVDTGTSTNFIKNVLVIGDVTKVLSDESFQIPYGPVTHIGTWTGALLITNPLAFVNTNVTLPNAAYPNIYFCPNRGIDVARTPARQTLEFAAQSKKNYIGSADLSHDPASPLTTKRFTFSHDDAALKKTIVNYVIAPPDPITGAGLDDYEIWFTIIRAV